MLPLKYHAPFELLSWRFKGTSAAQDADDAADTVVLRRRVLELQGRLVKVRSIKAASKAFYDGMSDKDCPLVALGNSLRTYLDRPSLWMHAGNGEATTYLNDVWFLKLTASAGLLLVAKYESSPLQPSRWSSVLQRVRLRQQDEVIPKDYERIGVFSCDHEADMHIIFGSSDIHKISLH